MVEEGYITEDEARASYREPLRIVAKDSALFTRNLMSRTMCVRS
jgi:hypothetical protein